jgi:crotonobetainyl-CoA:carnitine CoA-transferase CaiB-like acyl-CoA transferase
VNPAPAAEPEDALAGLRVLECGNGVAAAYATKLCADLGADVIKVEPPAGDDTRRRGPFPGGIPDQERSGLYLYLNTNKRGVVLDLDAAPDREALRRLAAASDLVVSDRPVGELDARDVGWNALRHVSPALVMTSITPFGLSGPYASYAATDLTLWAAGGVAFLNGGGPGTDDMPPLKAFGQQASFQGGVHAAVASLGALLARRRSGCGQHVEVSVQECIASILELTYPFWPYMGLVASRLGSKPIQPLDFLQCRDGWIYVCCIEEHQWRQFVAMMGDPEWAAMDLFQDRLARGVNWDALKLFLEEWVREQSVLDLYRAAQARRVPFAPVSTMGDLLRSEHLAARGFFAEIGHPAAGRLRYPGAPYKLGATPWRLRRAAPLLGEHGATIFPAVGVDPTSVAPPQPMSAEVRRP